MILLMLSIDVDRRTTTMIVTYDVSHSPSQWTVRAGARDQRGRLLPSVEVGYSYRVVLSGDLERIGRTMVELVREDEV